MSPLVASASRRIGVGIDTARYWHHATFLQEDLQPARAAFEFQENRAGYDRLYHALAGLAERHPGVHFCIRLDAAGQYAMNLEVFLRSLPWPTTLSVGEPKRNQRYREAISPKRKADPVDSACAARFALRERPAATAALPTAVHRLREVASRLGAQIRHRTRLVNQLHNLLARVFPELDMIVAHLPVQWVLELLERYPTPTRLARARLTTLQAIPYADVDKVRQLHQAARNSIGTFDGETAALLVRNLVQQLRAAQAAAAELEKRLSADYQALPQPNHLHTIKGFGPATAAVLTAKIASIDRFATPGHLVGYFGIFPEEHASGADKHGQPHTQRRQHMSRQGNDLVRKYLWMAAQTALLHNPAVRALYRRLRARGTRGDVALGHCMRKLLHLAFAVWKSGQPFDPNHYPWETKEPAPDTPAKSTPIVADQLSESAANKTAAGHNQGTGPEKQVVTAAASTVNPSAPSVKNSVTPKLSSVSRGKTFVDFAALRQQIRLADVLEHLGVLGDLKGSGPQRRGRCPVHQRLGTTGRSFAVHLDRNLFHCFHPPCGIKGNVLDLWAAVHHLPLVDAARHLAHTFRLDLNANTPGTEKRNP
jgi:transposase